MIDWGEGIITSSFWRIPRQDEHTPILFLWWENVGKRGDHDSYNGTGGGGCDKRMEKA